MDLPEGRVLVDPSILTPAQRAKVVDEALVDFAIAYAQQACYSLIGWAFDRDLDGQSDLDAAHQQLLALAATHPHPIPGEGYTE